MIYIVVFSTLWGYEHGGINSFNYDLCLELGKVCFENGIKLICFTYIDPAKKDADEAIKNNITIISLEKNSINLSIQNDINKIKGHLNKLKDASFFYFIGHDVFTGDIAIHLQFEFNKISASAVIHHMDYESYYNIKGNSTVSDLKSKISGQNEVLKSASIIIGVGPKLQESAKAKARGRVEMILPGMAQIANWPHNIQKMIAVTFGRYDERTDRLKQMGLASKAFAQFVLDNSHIAGEDATLKIIGISEDKDAEALHKVYTENLNRYINIIALPYESKRNELFEEISRSTLCLMLSVHEGFGLAGFEAIAAGVPLIFSSNSGLYNLLTTEIAKSEFEKYGLIPLHIDGSMDGLINQNDVAKVKNALSTIRSNSENFKNGVRSLKDILKNKYTWRATALSILDILKIGVADDNHSSTKFERLRSIGRKNVKNSDENLDQEIILEKSLIKLKQLYDNFQLENGCELVSKIITKYPLDKDVLRWWALFHNRTMDWIKVREVLNKKIKLSEDKQYIAECYLSIFESYLNEFTKDRHEGRLKRFAALRNAKEKYLEKVPNKSIDGKYYYFKARFLEEEWWVSSIESKKTSSTLREAVYSINKSIELYQTTTSGYPSSYPVPWWLFCHKCILYKLSNHRDFIPNLERYREMIFKEVEKTPLKSSVQMYAVTYFVLLKSFSALEKFFTELDKKIIEFTKLNNLKELREVNILDNFTYHHVEFVFYNDKTTCNKFHTLITNWFTKNIK